MQIAKIFKADKILTTKAYYAKQKGKLLPNNPYNWNRQENVSQNLTVFSSGFMRTTSTEPSAMSGF